MTTTELANWMAIYAATGLCCMFAFALSVTTVGIEVIREKPWRSIRGWKAIALFGPKLWLRWQKRYLFSTPVTLAIVGWFSATLDWTR